MFKYGIDGIKLAYKKSKLWLLFAMEVVIISMCIWLRISMFEFIIVILCSAILMALEMINTSIELICNFIEPNINSKIKEIKDISAGSVLLFTMFTFLIGCLIFIPKLVLLLC